MGQNFGDRRMETELQRNEHGELGGHQIAAVHSKAAFDALDKALQRLALHVVEFRRQYQASAGTQLAIVLVDQHLQD